MTRSTRSPGSQPPGNGSDRLLPRGPARRAPAAALAPILVLASLALGCDGSDPSQRAMATEPVPATAAAPGGIASPLLQAIAEAPTSVPFSATRRYEAYWKVDGQDEVLIYRESVLADGSGGFGIQPLEVLEPQMGSGPESLFLVLQKAREGFFFKHRDFGIRDLGRFLERWQVTDQGPTQMLGRACLRLDVQRQQDPDRVYHLTVDGGNGLVLRAEERDLSGALVSLLEFESLDLMPSLTGQALHQPVTSETLLSSMSSLQAELRFVPVQPKLIPEGFELLEMAAVEDPTRNEEWARFTYGDGVEELFFLHLGPPAEATVPGGGKVGGGGTGGGSTAGAGGPPEHTVRYARIGPWTLVFGDIDEQSYIAMGKVDQEDLLLLVESAFF